MSTFRIENHIIGKVYDLTQKNMCAMLDEIGALRAEKEIWGNEFNAVIILKEERDQLQIRLNQQVYECDKTAQERNRAEKERDQIRAAVKVMREALYFYADTKKWFIREEVVNLQETTAIFHAEDPASLPTEFKTKSYEVTARFKVDQGKTAQDAIAEADRVLAEAIQNKWYSGEN